MKHIFPYKSLQMFGFLMGVLLCTLGFTACDDDDSSGSKSPVRIHKVYLQDASSSVPDREVDFARIGQIIRIEGSGFTGMKRVYINGYNTYFNPVYVSDGSMLVSIGRSTPIADAEPEDRNTIRLMKEGSEDTFSIEIRAAAPTITNISHTSPKAGENIIIYGTGLLEIDRIVFPGDIEVTTGITSDAEGEFCIVTVPDGVSGQGGSIFLEGANGGAYSPAYFNFHPGVFLNFDDVGEIGSWGTTLSEDDLLSTPVGEGTTSQGNYIPHRPERIGSFGVNTNRCTEVWTSGDENWRSLFTPYIPADTPVDQVAFQFDMYVPDIWTATGYLKVLLVNNYNGGVWQGAVYNYIPWLADGEILPYQSDSWRTVTIPFSDFYAFSDPEGNYTFEDVLQVREEATYPNFGFYFENTHFTLANVTGNSSDSEIEFDSAETSISVFTDNWRVVSLETPSYSDFPEEDEEEE